MGSAITSAEGQARRSSSRNESLGSIAMVRSKLGTNQAVTCPLPAPASMKTRLDGSERTRSCSQARAFAF